MSPAASPTSRGTPPHPRRYRRVTAHALAAALLAVACSGGAQPSSAPTAPATSPPQAALPSPTTSATVGLPFVEPPPLSLKLVTDDLDFPLLLASPPSDARLFIVERAGQIRIVSDGSLLPQPFLDISDLTRTDGERGLLGLAFHPDYARNGRFFIHYSGAEDGDTRLAEYHVSTDPDRADPASGRLLLTAEQPASNHNGGMVAFGPDGYLYLGLGDGGASGDRFNNGQNPMTLLGSLLRLDVAPSAGDGRPYAIPPDNPFADGRTLGGVRGAPEVWAYGLRNPWRFSFDREAGLLYLADVGQNAAEEINVAPADAGGLNYGWPILEGSRCFRPRQGCSRQGLVLPVLEYPTGDGNCGVIGGYVYRGTRIPGLAGTYFYADLCGGWVRSFRYDPVHGVSDSRDYSDRFGDLGQIVSLGEDAAGELYVLNAEGEVNLISAE
ncbi:MAG: sorbosone dehydrogenase family protein [Nitriliruptorales bacterium]